MTGHYHLNYNNIHPCMSGPIQAYLPQLINSKSKDLTLPICHCFIEIYPRRHGNTIQLWDDHHRHLRLSGNLVGHTALEEPENRAKSFCAHDDKIKPRSETISISLSRHSSSNSLNRSVAIKRSLLCRNYSGSHRTTFEMIYVQWRISVPRQASKTPAVQ